MNTVLGNDGNASTAQGQHKVPGDNPIPHGPIGAEMYASHTREKDGQKKNTHDERNRVKRVVSTANAAKLPHPRDGFSRAVTEYVKLLLGFTVDTSRSGALMPAAPTPDEIAAWEERGKQKAALVKTALSDGQGCSSEQNSNSDESRHTPAQAFTINPVKQAPELVTIDFQSVLHPGSHRYSLFTLRSCEMALAAAGFPRCTFDWETGMKSEWNRVLSAVILTEWDRHCQDGANGASVYNFDRRKNTWQNRHGVLERWLDGKKSAYHHQTKGTKHQSSAPIDSPFVAHRSAQMKSKKQICAARMNTAKHHLASYPQALTAVEDLDVHSETEFEPVVGGTGPQVSINPCKHKQVVWRAQQLQTLLTLLDEAYVYSFQPGPARTKARALINRGSVIKPTPEEATSQFPPIGYPRNLVNIEGMIALKQLEVDDLKLSDPIDLQPACDALSTFLGSSTSRTADRAMDLT